MRMGSLDIVSFVSLSVFSVTVWFSPSLVSGQEEHATTPGRIEGRPAAAEVSPLQARVDAAAPGATVIVEAGSTQLAHTEIL